MVRKGLFILVNVCKKFEENNSEFDSVFFLNKFLITNNRCVGELVTVANPLT